MVKLFDTPRTWSTVSTSELLHDTEGVAPIERRPYCQNCRCLDSEERMPKKRWHPAVDEHAAREQDNGRRRPGVQVHVDPLRQHGDRIDDGRDKEPGVGDDLPHLIQVAVA